MRIGIEAQRLFRPRKHGMDMVALELIRNLQKVDTVNDYFIFVKPDTDDQVVTETANFHIVRIPGGPYPYWEQVLLPAAARKHRCDLLHCTSNTAPVFPGLPLMITLHDIIYLEKMMLFGHQGSWYQKFGNLYRRWVVPPVVRKSRVVITVSDFERERISRFFGMSPQNLFTVYNGVGRHFQPMSDETELDRIRRKYNLPRKFLFFLGNTDPKKNTRGVLQAVAGYRSRGDSEMKLVMLDYPEKALTDMLREIGCPELREHIFLTGYVVNTDLPGIINLSSVFLYPSLRESFGIPILEGMACGVPVITSNTSSMPEVAGDAALLVNPENPGEIAEAIYSLVNDLPVRGEMIRRGLERATRFSWEKMAENVLALYREKFA
ncbi:MAG TPA: glycosyltransferase family 1 protein [Bacteroidales bacterium]|nr:glycosyltransferase family 1 protein [Bacteroidales bacterium]HPS63128.1 glycosyltransferase family 1 protein [Bacteroidales bacterium]